MHNFEGYLDKSIKNLDNARDLAHSVKASLRDLAVDDED